MPTVNPKVNIMEASVVFVCALGLPRRLPLLASMKPVPQPCLLVVPPFLDHVASHFGASGLVERLYDVIPAVLPGRLVFIEQLLQDLELRVGHGALACGGLAYLGFAALCGCRGGAGLGSGGDYDQIRYDRASLRDVTSMHSYS